MKKKLTNRPIKWAILGTGCIANDMVQVLKQMQNTEVVAVGSRSYENAKWFQERWGISRSYSSYEGAASDDEVDVVYIATPLERHPEDCMMAIKQGKAVLCEKSMAPNHILGNEVLSAAKNENLLFVHGVWSRFFPAMEKIEEIINSGEIGSVRSARASFCQNYRAGTCSALLEVGIYCIQFLQWAIGDKQNANGAIVRGACQTVHESGYDDNVSGMIEFPGNKMGTFEASLSHCSERIALVYGSEGVIEVPFPFWCPTQIKVTKMTGLGSQLWSETQAYSFPLPETVKPIPVVENGKSFFPGFNFINSQGLFYEAAEVNRCFREGLTESPFLSTLQCYEILRLMSDIREIAARGYPYGKKRVSLVKGAQREKVGWQ